ncbi:MAG: DNA polymerase III subunit delta', partial [Parahaliea sp.]
MELSALPRVNAPLPWQAPAWQQLLQQLESGRFPHALLVAGMPGIGKQRLALALARLLLCHSPSAGHNCGQCSACEFSRSGAHGDFRWLQPEEGSRTIRIDAIREVVNFANRTAGFGQRKVLVIAPADAMNSNAANALLKSLEEPAANTHILLVCDRLHGVPATIRSRCQLLRLPVLAADAALAWLDTLTGARASSSTLLDLARGRPLVAAQ